jgi:hypothetical protein
MGKATTATHPAAYLSGNEESKDSIVRTETQLTGLRSDLIVLVSEALVPWTLFRSKHSENSGHGLTECSRSLVPLAGRAEGKGVLIFATRLRRQAAFQKSALEGAIVDKINAPRMRITAGGTI